MRIKGKRIFNYRPMLWCALSLVFGIILSEAFYGESVWAYVALSAIFVAAICVVAAFKKSRKFVYIPIAALVGIIAMTSVNLQYNSVSLHNYTGNVTVRVNSEIVYNGKSYAFDADRITIDGKTIKYEARVYAYLDDAPDFSPGDTVTLEGKLKYFTHTKFDNYYPRKVSSGQRYSFTAYSASKVASGELDFPENLQVGIKRILHTYLDDKTASIVQALVIGDKAGIDSDMYDDIKSSGLAHVLAVSGLHVSTLATALYFVLKKLKVNPKISFVVVLIATFLYSMLCSFTASSLRAVIMSGVYMFSSAFSRKKDDLSSISLAAIVILLVRPADLFDVGFLLSFASVTGIFLFDRPFERTGLKIVDKISPKRKIGTNFAKVCALSFATNLFTLPFVAYFFGEVPTLFVLSNWLILPYIMAFYVTAIVLTLLAVITGIGAIVTPLKYLLVPFRLFVGLVGSVSISTVSVSADIVMLVALVVGMVIASRFVFVDRVKKCRAVCLTLCAALALRSVLVVFC